MAYQGGLIVLFVLPLPQDSKLGFGQFTDSFVLMCGALKKNKKKTPLFPRVNTSLPASSHTPGSCLDFFFPFFCCRHHST